MSECVLKKLACRGLRVGPSKLQKSECCSATSAVQLLQCSFPKITAQLLFSLVACCRVGFRGVGFRGVGLRTCREIAAPKLFEQDLVTQMRKRPVCRLSIDCCSTKIFSAETAKMRASCDMGDTCFPESQRHLTVFLCARGVSTRNFGMRLPLTGAKIPKIGKRGFRSQKTPISYHPGKGRFVSKNSFLYRALQGKWGFFDSEHPFRGGGGNGDF